MAARAGAKPVLLVLSLAVLLARPFATPEEGLPAPTGLIAYFGVVALYALLGLAGFLHRAARLASALAAGLLTVAVAWATFADVVVLAGALGVLVSILLRPPADRPARPRPAPSGS